MALPSKDRDSWFLSEINAGNFNISDCGGYIFYNGKAVKQRLAHNGYLFINVKGRTLAAHRLVFLYFKGVIGDLTINHLDSNKRNNPPSNLDPCSHKGQFEHFKTSPKYQEFKEHQKLAKSGELNPLAKFDKKDIDFIRAYRSG